ncbi:hypothetical protein IMSAG049_00162 [Clostridiales bacterium]|nr:hypothetical protein IMSAG049_00162 [Clostridiales bacterium]
MKVAYPRYYADKSAKELENAVSLWHTMLEDYPVGKVNLAVKALIATSKYPPDISDVIERINFLAKPDELTEMEAWGLVKRALSNSTYNCVEEFEKLPPELKFVVGSPSILRQWAQTDTERLETVVASNFMRSFRAKEKTRKELAALPKSVMVLIEKTKFDMIDVD